MISKKYYIPYNINKNSKKKEIDINNKIKGLIYAFKIFNFICFIILFLRKKNKILKFKNLKIYINKNINNIDNNLIFKIKKVVYSALLGNYDSLKQFKKQEEFEYILFTDLLIIGETNWTILKLPENVRNLNLSIRKKQRFIKLHPHLYFKYYDLSIYIDSNFIIYGNINEFLERIIAQKINIYVYEHPNRKCIYTEIKRVLELKKEKKNIGLKVLIRYRNNKYPINSGLSENCLIVRRHNKKDCIYLMEKWWKEVEHYSYRDQLSFNYIKWKTKIKIKYISKSFGLEYFKSSKHLKKLNKL